MAEHGLSIERVDSEVLGLPVTRSATWGVEQLQKLARYEASQQQVDRQFPVGAYAIYRAIAEVATARWAAGWTYDGAPQRTIPHPSVPLVWRESFNQRGQVVDWALELPIGMVATGGGLWSSRVLIATTGANLEECERFLDDVASAVREAELWAGTALSCSGLDEEGQLVSAFVKCERLARPVWAESFHTRLDKLLIGPILDGVTRRALAYGPYGSGKSYAVRYLCGELSAVGRPIVRVDAPTAPVFLQAWTLASQRAGAVVVVEDIDAIADDADVMRSIFNMIDGGDKSSGRPSLLATTNHPERVQLPLLRPGRFDDVIFVGLPSVAELLKLLRTDDVAVAETAHAMGLSAAEACEIVQRAEWLGGDYVSALASYEDYRRLVRVRMSSGASADCLGGLHALLAEVSGAGRRVPVQVGEVVSDAQ